MEILWLAIIMYSAGLALVLHLRPALMFNEDGTWKEFGYQRSPRHTLLPFWLFVIIWAFLSYAIAAALSWMLFAPALAAAAAPMMYSPPPILSVGQDEEEEEEEEGEEEEEDTEANTMPMTTASSLKSDIQNLVQTESQSQKRGPGRPRKETGNPKAGYYIREENSEGGLNRYIYYGPEAPGEGQVAAMRLPNATPYAPANAPQ
jgi:hypothetical protein